MKQHELLAIKSGIKGKVQKIKTDLADLFANKKHHFSRILAVFKPVKEGIPEVKEQDTAMQTTVGKEMTWYGTEFAKLVDVCHNINLTNCEAKADVLIGDVKLLENIPATGLLELEKLVKDELKALIAAIPTLDPVKGFAKDEQQGEKGQVIYRSTSMRERTAKELYALELAPATDKHPAQVSKESRDVKTGEVHTQEWSGMLTPSEKAEMLTRCEDVLTAIKAAQSRANDTEAKKVQIGDKLVKYILG